MLNHFGNIATMSVKKDESIKFSISGDSLEDEETGAAERIPERIPEHGASGAEHEGEKKTSCFFVGQIKKIM